MFKLTLDGSKQIDVSYKNHVIGYAMDGSRINPLEATYAALAACAGVYAYKACKAMGLSSQGIAVECKPVMRGGDMLMPARFVTEVTFPENFSSEQRQQVLDEIGQCAVKKMIHDGSTIEFETREKA